MSPSQQASFTRCKLLSAVIWLFLPTFILIAFRASPWERHFRALPFNDSYDAMFVAATGGIGLSSLWLLFSYNRYRQRTKRTVLPAYSDWRNAVDLFELFACASLGILNFVAGAPAAGMFWSAAFFSLLAGSMALLRA